MSDLVFYGALGWLGYVFYRAFITQRARTPEYPCYGWKQGVGWIIEPKPRRIVRDGVVYEERVIAYKRVDFWGNVYQ